MSLHTWNCQGPRKPSSCVTFISTLTGAELPWAKIVVSMCAGSLLSCPDFLRPYRQARVAATAYKHGQKELPHVRGQWRWPRVPGCNSAAAAERSYPTSEVRGSGHEELPDVQGAVAARVQEGLEKLFHVQGQEGQR